MQRITDKTNAWKERAAAALPGGVNSPVRAFAAVGGTPVMAERGEGSFVFDVDDNRYLDFMGSWGPLILGHAHPDIVAAVKQAAENGIGFGLSTKQEVEFAELIKRAMPSIEKLRMVNSGTEAGMSAVRLARGFTGRDLIVKFAGCYHGHSDALLVAAGSGALTFGAPTSAGVPKAVVEQTAVLPFNDLKAVTEFMAEHGEDVAAIMLEPVAGNMGVVAPIDGFLKGLRDACDTHGSLLILDEVMTGFRLAFGGAQERFEVRADITMLSKIIGGGLQVGAYGGRSEIMDCISPLGDVYQAGTLSGNPLTVAAGLAQLKILEKDKPYEKLEGLGGRLEKGLRPMLDEMSRKLTFSRVGSMFTLFFGQGPMHSLDAVQGGCDVQVFGRFHQACLDRGVLLPPSQFEAAFLSTAHTDEQIDQLVQVMSDSVAQVLR